ncbi:hypothetical protein NKDENANG_00611 [Candidatus Entotheonellaceae bacterium PAL068K]
MRIGLVSYHPTATSSRADIYEDFLCLRQFVLTLVGQGLQVVWLSSTDTATALADDVSLAEAEAHDLPPTCRHVVPCQPYRFGGARLLCVDRDIWQHPELHTRLFTFLGLLHRELPCAVLHAWGMFHLLYLTVYTACFLRIPVAASFAAPNLQHDAQDSFRWQWLARHVSVALVSSQTNRTRLLGMSDLTPERVRIVDPAQPTSGPTLTALYGELRGLVS